MAAIGVAEALEKYKTVFPRINGKPNGQPFIWDYQVKGYLKSAAQAMARVSDSVTAKTKAYLKIIGDCVFVSPRKIPLCYKGADKGEVGSCQRPLRASSKHYRGAEQTLIKYFLKKVLIKYFVCVIMSYNQI